MKSHNLVCDVEVSKDIHDLYHNGANGTEHYLKISNDTKGHDLLIGKLGITRTYRMKISGSYYLRLAFSIKKLNGDVRVENLIAIKRLIQIVYGAQQIR